MSNQTITAATILDNGADTKYLVNPKYSERCSNCSGAHHIVVTDVRNGGDSYSYTGYSEDGKRIATCSSGGADCFGHSSLLPFVETPKSPELPELTEDIILSGVVDMTSDPKKFIDAIDAKVTECQGIIRLTSCISRSCRLLARSC